MKIRLFNQKLIATLSCILKCLRFIGMIHRKVILGLFLLVALGACGPTAMLGPVYTLTATGSVTQAGLSYGSSELISKQTGKTPIENIIEITSSDQDENIHKKTLESNDFQILLKSRITKTISILNLSNQ
jgi:hypothetical protein